ncbi:MAG: DUF4197 domain-containing protein [Geminicoccaceae bacterium]|nr:DUF4197 domain-containing protein [Geminicoccaceae bacterium]
MFERHRRIAWLILGMAFFGVEASAQGLFDKVKGTLGDLPALGGGSDTTGLPTDTVASGLREALQVATDRAVAQLGRSGGFVDSERFHIPLPGVLADAQGVLRMAGLSAMADDLELRMNRAAEQAVPLAGDLFKQAIAALSFDDVMAIYNGPDDAATQYLERTTGDTLEERMRPIIDEALADAGAVQVFDQLTSKVSSLPMLGSLSGTLDDHVLEQASGALFAFVASEEKAIRENPTQRTTELLRTVFGGG